MTPRRVTIAVVIVAGILAAAFGWQAWRNTHALDSNGAVLARLPTQDAILLSIDFRALRNGGVLDLLAGSPSSEEADYRKFVQETNFDYRHDLEAAWVAFTPEGMYLLARGQFDWPKLESYARQNQGSCYRGLCHLIGSRPDRHISFVPVRKDLMGLAVSTDDLAVSKLLQAELPNSSLAVPNRPVWMTIPRSALPRAGTAISAPPALAPLFFDVERVTLDIGPKDGNFEIGLEALCDSQSHAAALAGELGKAAALMAVQKKAGPNDLTSLLSSGRFRQDDRRVLGQWPLQRSFLANLAGGV